MQETQIRLQRVRAQLQAHLEEEGVPHQSLAVAAAAVGVGHVVVVENVGLREQTQTNPIIVPIQIAEVGPGRCSGRVLDGESWVAAKARARERGADAGRRLLDFGTPACGRTNLQTTHEGSPWNRRFREDAVWISRVRRGRGRGRKVILRSDPELLPPEFAVTGVIELEDGKFLQVNVSQLLAGELRLEKTGTRWRLRRAS
jgi:hypothetical protein